MQTDPRNNIHSNLLAYRYARVGPQVVAPDPQEPILIVANFPLFFAQAMPASIDISPTL